MDDDLIDDSGLPAPETPGVAGAKNSKQDAPEEFLAEKRRRLQDADDDVTRVAALGTRDQSPATDQSFSSAAKSAPSSAKNNLGLLLSSLTSADSVASICEGR